MMPSSSIQQDLLLIGGGHSHAIVLKQFGMNPLPGVRLTLITNVVQTPYSGMLPGYVAGLYRFEECHIDLRPLSNFAQARMIRSAAVGLDLNQNQVLLADRPPIRFDWLSIDIGSTPTTLSVPGADQYAIPVKPIAQFLQYWDQVVEQVQTLPDRPIRIGIVGGGAGGVELALSVQARLQRIYRHAGQPNSNLTLHLFQRSDRLLPERHPKLGQRLQQILSDRGGQVHLHETVCQVEGRGKQAEASRLNPPLLQGGRQEQAGSSLWQTNAKEVVVRCKSGLTVDCDILFWVTQASAAPWLQQAGLSTSEQGFVQVNPYLQSLSHPQVFAAGDVATMAEHPRPKAGVFAVRAGKPLAENLRHALLRQPLQPFIPQKQFLILVGTGEGSALASRGILGLPPHPWIWQWKDWIDRRFMAKFCNLEPMTGSKPLLSSPSSPSSPASSSSSPAMPCAGCGSKVASSILERVLKRIRQDLPSSSDILLGLESAEDAAVFTLAEGKALVQTVDHFRALVDDPFLFGQIAAQHCLSDLFAMGAKPHSALAIVTLPYGTAPIQEEMLYQLLSGAVKALDEAGAVLVGGHTTEGSELAFGLTCNGIAPPDQLWRKAGMQPGHQLILTKAIGTGTLFAADMRLQAKGDWIEAALESMRLSNQKAADCLRQYPVAACTDITGFGLLGHLLEMMRASQVSVELDLNALPVIEGAKETTGQGIVSSLYAQNVQASQWIPNRNEVSHHPLYPLLFDPQTSGGLLVAIPADRAHACLADLVAAGYTQSRIVGTVGQTAKAPVVTIKI